MRVHVYFSVHEQVFGPVLQQLQVDHDLRVSGFVWGKDQQQYLRRSGLVVEPLTVFTREILDHLDDTPADLAYLAEWEQRSGVPLQHMIIAERHLIHRYNYEQLLRLSELIFRRAEVDFDSIRPDVYFSEDVACLTSYIHWIVARDRGVRVVFINNARFPHRVTTYGNQFQAWDRLDELFPDTPPGVITSQDLEAAAEYIREFRERPVKPIGLLFRSRLPVGSMFDLGRLTFVARRWLVDPRNPTLTSPHHAMLNRGRRLVRSYLAEASGLFDRPRPNEPYVLYPLHFQPEATTLVLAPYFLNQLALIEDIAKSLPAGHRLYVKEHVVSRGRWPLSFYRAIRRIPGVRLLGPTEDTKSLILGSAAIAVISGTMGWEAVLYDKPVITFGHVFYNRYPLVHRASEAPKQDWPALFKHAIFEHTSDPELLCRFVACAHRATSPGLTGNPTSLPEILEPENLRKLAVVLSEQFGLTSPLRPSQSRSA